MIRKTHTSAAKWVKLRVDLLILVSAFLATGYSSAQLVLNGGDSRVVPIDFSGTDPGHDRWILRGGTLTIDSGTYETTSATPHRIGQLGTGSLITVNGGLISAPNATVSMGSAGGEGTLTLNGGGISFLTLDAGGDGFGGAGTGSGTINVNGSTGTFTVLNNFTLRNSTLNFVFDANGITPITTTNFNISDPAAVININGAAYTGAAGIIDLVQFTGTGPGALGTVAINGFDPALFASSSVGLDADSFFINLVAPVIPSGGGGGGAVIQPSTLLTDLGAISQLSASAIPMNIALGQLGTNIHHVGSRSFNQRVYRLRHRIGSTGFAQNSDSGRSREVSVSRIYRMERQLKMENTIDLTGRAPSANHHSQYESAVIDDKRPFAPSVTRQAAGGAVAGPSIFEMPSIPFLDNAGAQMNSGIGNLFCNLETFASFDYGQYDLNNSTGRGFESNTYAGTIGVEHVVTPCLAVGLGWSHVTSDNELNNGLGSIDIEGDAVIGYASYFKNNWWADLLYSHGSYEADLNRNTLLGSRVGAIPEISSHLTTLNFGRNIACDDRFVHGPTFRADYSRGEVDGYTETGDPRANTTFGEQDYESLITTLGWQLNWKHETCWGALRPTLRLGYGRENIDQNTNVSGTLQNSPFALVQGGNITPGASFSNSLASGEAGTDWMELGAGMGFEFNTRLGLFFDYQGRFFQNNAQLHLGTVKASWTF